MTTKNPARTTCKFPYTVKKDERSKLQKLTRAVWNNEEKTILGRTTRSWGLLTLFYLLFYIVLAILFALCMLGLLATVDEEKPKLTMHESLIGINPGVGFRPSPYAEYGSLIWYVARNDSQVRTWADNIDEFLKSYEDPETPDSVLITKPLTNRVPCTFDRPPSGDEVCAINLTAFANCTADKLYSYRDAAPCIFLKLNKIYGWVPDVYDEVSSFPEDMPGELKNHIASLPENARKQIWLSCEGETPVDRENLGPISYAPTQGLPFYFYPYTNQKGYLSPLVAVQFQRPKLNRIINIRCRAWAKNIKYSTSLKNVLGSVHVEFMID